VLVDPVRQKLQHPPLVLALGVDAFLTGRGHVGHLGSWIKLEDHSLGGSEAADSSGVLLVRCAFATCEFELRVNGVGVEIVLDLVLNAGAARGCARQLEK